jgi:tetratricopeptide (TPR) repeat protein
VNALLRNHLIALGDAVIADYRREESIVSLADWRQANDAFRWALELTPHDTNLLAKQLVCEGHLTRIAAQNQSRLWGSQRQSYADAISKFQRAARLDTALYDPYLGISRTAVYGVDDVDAAADAIKEAEKRGFKSGRRERAQLGDGYLRRAEKSRRFARTLSGDRRHRELENAQSDYLRCIEMFDPIVGFAGAARNLELCKRRLDWIVARLEAPGDRP